MKKYIEIREFCKGHDLEEGFVYELYALGIIKIKKVDELAVLRLRDLGRLERLVRMHRDLELNVQGLQAVQHVLDQLEIARNEIRALRTMMGRWE